MVKLADHKLYTMAPLPNPRRLHMFLVEKGVEVEQVHVDVVKGEHKNDDFMARNMDGRVPVLELPDGSYLSETVAIAQYVDEKLHADGNEGRQLFGESLIERANVTMWNRRVEIEFTGFIISATRYGPFHTVLKYPDNPAVVTEALRVANGYLVRLDKELEKKKFVALGDRVTMADFSLYCVIDFARKSCKFDLGNDGRHKNIERWIKDMEALESVKACPGM